LGRGGRPGVDRRGARARPPRARVGAHRRAVGQARVINLKTRHEIELMATAGRLLSTVIEEMKAECRPGLTTGDLDRLADRLIRAGGARPGFLGYQDFPRATCIPVNDEVV